MTIESDSQLPAGITEDLAERLAAGNNITKAMVDEYRLERDKAELRKLQGDAAAEAERAKELAFIQGLVDDWAGALRAATMFNNGDPDNLGTNPAVHLARLAGDLAEVITKIDQGFAALNALAATNGHNLAQARIDGAELPAGIEPHYQFSRNPNKMRGIDGVIVDGFTLRDQPKLATQLVLGVLYDCTASPDVKRSLNSLVDPVLAADVAQVIGYASHLEANGERGFSPRWRFDPEGTVETEPDEGSK